MKRIVKLFVVALAFIIAVGCGKKTKWTKDDVKDYIERNYGIIGYKMPDKSTSEKINDTYSKNVWKIEYKDITFKVYENIGDFPSGSDHLSDDFYNIVLDYYTDKYGKDYNLKFEYATENNGHLICSVTSNDDVSIKKCYDDMYSFVSKIDFKTYPVKFIQSRIVDSNGKSVVNSSIYSDGKIKSYEEFKK